MFGSTADARGKRKFLKRSFAERSLVYEPRYADIVVDANTGDVLHSTNPDAQRHPASLTKIMTLYLLFERFEVRQAQADTQDGRLRPMPRARRRPSSACAPGRP